MTLEDFEPEGRPNHWRNKETGELVVCRAGQTPLEVLAALDMDAAPRRVVSGTEFIARVTDDEMMAVLNAADNNAQIRRWVEQLRILGEIDLDGATARAAKAGLVAAGLLTAQRAKVVFA